MAKRSERHSNLPLEHRIEIINPRTHIELGKIKKKKYRINGQDIYNGNVSRFTRAAFMYELKKYLASFVQKEIEKGLTIPEDWYGRISVSLEIHKKKKGQAWDCDNQWLWIKAFQDVLVNKPLTDKEGYDEFLLSCSLLPDDSINYIIESSTVRYVQIDDNVSPNKLVFIIKKI
jgi:hypothetical protein